MQSENPDETTLSGSILLADPALMDPHFHRSVLILHQHSPAKGAEGFILNRPMHRCLGDFLSGEEFRRLRRVPVFIGGPVDKEHVVLASLSPDPLDGKIRFRGRISANEAAARLEEGFTIQAFVGYAGWSAGQLEGEIKEAAWIFSPPHGSLLDLDPGEMWSEALGSISPLHYILSKTPTDPSLN